MSHFTTLKTKIVEKTYLKQALDDLGHSYQEGNLQIDGYQGNKTTAEIKVLTQNASYDIGFRKNGEGYEMVADWWGIREINQQTFVESLNQRYAYHAATAKLAEQGFSLVSEEVEETGRIHLVLRRVV
ncbi:DUF1257 domain-containing protein [Synechocystis sp. PCC 7339]|uniref:DUF1257 domain-containing protein n=1 Tax=unclassified Synechocystis TaxID=2640012 RepID=UPI001BAF5039|nr:MULTISPECIES: DUF1257 domain-containing protein [unclassified Synechocystis]QUS61727.1 DUF1257 domain-containing protein [Synechocystis sp. PCC 7338]UAJ73925.1 DUF1257 domain-containing protein [Synechocystis sp. PCC 7339]